jgi:hypothetical protein
MDRQPQREAEVANAAGQKDAGLFAVLHAGYLNPHRLLEIR